MDYCQACNIHQKYLQQMTIGEIMKQSEQLLSALINKASWDTHRHHVYIKIICVCVSVFKMLSRRKMSHQQTFNYPRMEVFGSPVPSVTDELMNR